MGAGNAGAHILFSSYMVDGVVTDFISKLIEILQYLSPVKIIYQWENGCRYRFGKYKKTLKPGIYFIIPFFQEIKTDTIVPDLVQSPLQTITLSDGKTLTYSAQFTLRIYNLGLAYNNVSLFKETAREIASAGLADTFAVLPSAELLNIPTRCAACDYAEKYINKSLEKYGMVCDKISLINFAIGMRTIRLITDDNKTVGTK